jgi:thioredoxin 2
MAPMFEKAAAALEPGVRLLKLNSDQAPQLSARLGIRSIPTMLLMKSGQILARTSGAMNSDQIVRWTKSNLASDGAANR